MKHSTPAVDGGKVASSIRWTGAVRAISQIATFLTTIVVLRYLSRDEYGVLNMAYAVMLVIDTVIDFGFAAALVQRKEVSETEYSACFWLMAVAAIAVILVCWSGAEAFAWLFGEARLVEPLRATLLAFLVTPIQVFYRAHHSRRFELAYLAKLDLLGLAVRSVISVAGAVAGLGLWGLVAGFVGEKILVAFVMLVYGRPIPVTSFRLREVSGLMEFGIKFTLSRIVHALYLRTDTFLVGRLLGAETLGLYSLAQQFTGAVVQLIGTTATKISFPLFSAYQDSALLLRTFSKAERLTMLLSFSSLAGIGLVADDLIAGMMSGQWLKSSWFVQILAVPSILNMFASLVPQLLNAKGRSGMNVLVNLVTVGSTASILYVSIIMWGVDGLFIGLLGGAAARVAIVLWFGKRVVPELDISALFRSAAEVCLAVIAMATVVVAVRMALGASDPWIRLVAATSMGGLTYIAVNLLLFKTQTLETLRMARR